MRITAVRLNHFRNYESLSLIPAEGLNVLVGENAAGKTNILEALFLAALGKSHRAAKDAELIRFGEEYANADVSLVTRAGTRRISVCLGRREKKRILVDGARLTRSGELMGCLNVVLFAPEDLSLVKDGPAERRRFLNMALSQQTPRYYYLLQQYNAALKQRNALLKNEVLPDDAEFAPWEEQLARAGAGITRLRAAFTQKLETNANRAHARITDGAEELLIRYAPSLEGDDDLEGRMLERLRDGRRKDGFRGGTGVGPHRDDIVLYLGGTEARAYGSQGQQRTAVLSLKLAEMEILSSIRGEKPVLLLDDVFSELDRTRQRLLLDACEGGQTFITCTHVDALRSLGALNMRLFRVEAGNVTEE